MTLAPQRIQPRVQVPRATHTSRKTHGGEGCPPSLRKTAPVLASEFREVWSVQWGWRLGHHDEVCTMAAKDTVGRVVTGLSTPPHTEPHLSAETPKY